MAKKAKPAPLTPEEQSQAFIIKVTTVIRRLDPNDVIRMRDLLRALERYCLRLIEAANENDQEFIGQVYERMQNDTLLKEIVQEIIERGEAKPVPTKPEGT